MAWAAKMERLAINERLPAERERVEAEERSSGAVHHAWTSACGLRSSP
jgi:hypothetical protein